MKIHLLSDLHLEFADRHPPWAPPATDADVVVLAGDIHTGLQAFDWAERIFPDRPVLYVAGNHEFYGHDHDAMREALRTRSARSANVQLLDNDTTVIGGVRFVGTTLWTDFEVFGKTMREASIEAARRVMMDYHAITTGKRNFTPERSLELFVEGRAYLEQVLTQPHAGRTVAVTHHAPHPGSIHPRWAKDLASGAFASDLGSLLDRADLWVHGHTHDSFDYRVRGSRVVANPMGYRESDWLRPVPEAARHKVRLENADFDAGLVIELTGP